MVSEDVARSIGPFLLRALYRESGVPHGRALVLDCRRAALLMGLTRHNGERASLSQLKHVSDLLRWFRDHPPPGWSVESRGREGRLVVFITPAHATSQGALERQHEVDALLPELEEAWDAP